MSDAPDSGAKPAKSKKLMIIVLAAVVVLGGGGAGALLLLKKPKGGGGEEAAEQEVAHAKPGTPPTFLPLDSLVVNLADPGGDRFAQIGITLEISDAHTADQVKAFMPIIRSGILVAVSQRTTQELLQVEGKEKLAADIKREVSRPLGLPEDDDEEDEPPKKAGKAKKKRPAAPSPIRRVLFSSFIVQ